MKITALCLTAGFIGFMIGDWTGVERAKAGIKENLEDNIPMAVKMLSDSFTDLARGTITEDELAERLASDMEFMKIVNK